MPGAEKKTKEKRGIYSGGHENRAIYVKINKLDILPVCLHLPIISFIV